MSFHEDDFSLNEFLMSESFLRSGLDEGKRKVKTLNPREGQKKKEKREADSIKNKLHLIHRYLKARDTGLQ